MTRPDPYPDLGLQAVREGLGVVVYVRGAFPADGARLGVRAGRARRRVPVLARVARTRRGPAALGRGARRRQGELRKSRSARSVDQNASSSHGSSAGSKAMTSVASSVVRGCSVVVARYTISTTRSSARL